MVIYNPLPIVDTRRWAGMTSATETGRSMSNVVSLQLPPGTQQPSHAAVVIIGGGIMGTSIAFHLAEAGVRNIVLVDRSELGAGSSAKPLGGVRATFSDPANIVLGQRSLRAFEGF